MLKTKSGESLAVTELVYDDVIQTINLMYPDLAKVMRSLNKGTKYTFYKASYRFGDKIINNGKCYLPLSDGGSISFDSPELPDKLRNDLIYKRDNEEDPLGLSLNRISEFYLPGHDGIQAHSIIRSGSMFGVTKATDDEALESSTSVLELNLNAGARSLFMLSKISDKTHHVKLQREYGIVAAAPSAPQDHWEVFVELANKANSDWRCEIIYFPRDWINQLKSDDWSLLSKKLLALHRSTYTVLHRSSKFWDKGFEEINHDRNLTNYAEPSRVTAKLLFEIAANSTPGFKPAVNDSAAPISLITKAYNEVYNKVDEEKNSAVIMEPAYLNKNDEYPIYYSINYSPFSQENLQLSNKRSQIALLDEIRRITEIYSDAILKDKQGVKSLYMTTKNTTFDFYHTDSKEYPRIHSAKLLPDEDPRFVENQPGDFPSSSSFFRGCIKISRVG